MKYMFLLIFILISSISNAQSVLVSQNNNIKSIDGEKTTILMKNSVPQPEVELKLESVSFIEEKKDIFGSIWCEDSHKGTYRKTKRLC